LRMDYDVVVVIETPPRRFAAAPLHRHPSKEGNYRNHLPPDPGQPHAGVTMG